LAFITDVYSAVTRSFSLRLSLVFIVSLVVFLILRSSDYLAVDGALRALQVYYTDRPFLHSNNHLLYAVNLYIWTTMLRAIGIVARDPVSFLRLAQALNAAAAAACLTIFYGILYRLTNRGALSALATCGFGLCTAFLAHATNSAEPMVGLLWSELSVAVAAYGLSQGQKSTLVVAGMILALAMATYQSMVLFGVPIAMILWQSPKLYAMRPTWWSTIANVGPFVMGFGLGIPIIYGTAYYLSGIRAPAEMVSQFLHLEGSSQGYGGVTFIKFASVLPGLAASLFPCLPPECGFRCLLERRFLSWLPITALALVIAGAILCTLFFLTRMLLFDMTAKEKLAISGCAVGFLTTIVPLIFWMPTYDKLWLQPLACLFLTGGLLLTVALRRFGFRVLRIGAGIVLAAIVASNLVSAISAAIKPTPYLIEAREVAALVAPGDLIIGDWNSIFVLYQAFWAPRANSFNVPTIAGLERSDTIPHLTDRVAQTARSGGHIFFLGILDLSKQDWKLALGDKRGIAYEQFDPYRSSSETVMSFPSRARAITLRRLSR
jgi:hypothetical protein